MFPTQIAVLAAVGIQIFSAFVLWSTDSPSARTSALLASRQTKFLANFFNLKNFRNDPIPNFWVTLVLLSLSVNLHVQ